MQWVKLGVNFETSMIFNVYVCRIQKLTVIMYSKLFSPRYLDSPDFILE